MVDSEYFTYQDNHNGMALFLSTVLLCCLSFVVCVVECAERDTKASLSHLVSDEMSGTTCPPEHLVRCSEKTKLLLEELVASCEEYSADTKSESQGTYVL